VGLGGSGISPGGAANPLYIAGVGVGNGYGAGGNGEVVIQYTAAGTVLGVANISGAVGQSVNLSATLTDATTGSGIPDETVTFTVGGVSAGSGTTAANGDVSVPFTIPASLPLGANTITANFAGDSTYPATTGNATLTVTSSSTVTISGVVTLQGSVNEAQSITFTIQPTSNLSSMTTQTVTLSSSGAYMLTGITPGTYNIAAKGDRWLQAVVSNVNATSAASGVDLTLIPGDLNGDNQISLADLLLLLKAYGSTPSSSNWNPVADLNCDGQVSLTDLLLLLKNYGKLGQTLPSS
jgi:hypothetical protein